MNSLDTHVLARFFIDDDQDSEAGKQQPAAIAAMSAQGYVTVTVILEFEWVMRGFYALRREQIGAVLRALAGIEHIIVEDRGAILNAIDAYDAGLDFADALHLARSGRCATLLSFDRSFAKRAKALGAQPPVTLLT